MCKVQDVHDTRKTVFYELRDGYKGFTAPFEYDGDEYSLAWQDTPVQDALRSSGVDPADVTKWHARPYFERDTVYISDHAMMRLNKRLGWKKKTAVRMTKRVYDNGTPQSEMDSLVKKWLKVKEAEIPRRKNSHIYYMSYGQYLFVFDGQILVTAYNMTQKSAIRAAVYKHRGYNRAAFKRGEACA